MHLSQTHGKDFKATFYNKGILRGKIFISKEGIFLAFNDKAFKSAELYNTNPPTGFKYLFKLGDVRSKKFLLPSKGISKLTISDNKVNMFGVLC